MLDGMSLISDSFSETSAEDIESSAPEDESPERNSIKQNYLNNYVNSELF